MQSRLQQNSCCSSYIVAEINAPGMKTLAISLQRSSEGNTMDVGYPAVFHGQVLLWFTITRFNSPSMHGRMCQIRNRIARSQIL